MSLSSISFNKRICLFLILFLFSISHKAFAEKNNIKPVINLPDAVAKLRAGNDIDAFLDFQILATEGNVDAQAYFGEMYRKGRGFGKNFIKAEEWLSKAAEGGSASAYHRLGWMYARGEISGSRNNKMAVENWKKASELGDPYAQSDLGVMYWRGEGTEKDLILAYKWLMTSFNQLGKENINLDNLKKEMTLNEIDKANNMLTDVK